MKPQTSGIRKAAILVASLDRPVADRLLDQMDPGDAQRVRLMAAELDDVDPEEQRQIVDEFFRVKPMVPRRHPPGVELDGQLARTLFPPNRFSSAEATEPGSSEDQPFCFLHDAEGEKLARLLASERPQTIALVLSRLPPRQAGNVLVRLSPALQVDVLRRLVELEETEPEILRDVENALRSRFSEQVLIERRRVAGLPAVRGILEASDKRVGIEILDNLASHDRQLAERLSPERPDFGDLANLDDATLAAVFQATGPELATLALVGAPPALIQRALCGLSEPEVRLVCDRLDHPGPTRLSDVEEARRRIADVAHRWAIEGRIELPHKRRALQQEAYAV